MSPNLKAVLADSGADGSAGYTDPERTGQLLEAAGVSAMLLVTLALLLCAGILVFALVLRHRAKNPTPETLLIQEVIEEQNEEEAFARTHSDSKGKELEPWEKPDDWWKPDDQKD